MQDREHGRNLRSTTTTLCQPFTTTTFAKRAFRCSAPAVWNSLPQTVLSSDSVAVLKSRLKTFLFSQAFSSSSTLTNTLPGPSASEVTTLWRYTNLFIIIIIIIQSKTERLIYALITTEREVTPDMDSGLKRRWLETERSGEIDRAMSSSVSRSDRRETGGKSDAKLRGIRLQRRGVSGR